GHEADESTGIKWDALARLDGTIVFMMGFANLPVIVQKLTEHGMPRDRAAAVISNATRRDQRTVTGSLADIEAKAAAANLPTPALIVVGHVVRMHDVINWFETKPLFGKRIVVTRAREQASDLKRLLEDSGANVVQFPTIEITAPESFQSLDRAVNETWDWLIFTSSNGAAAILARTVNVDSSLAGARTADVGAAQAAGHGHPRRDRPREVRVDFVASALPG